jgi:hypothetical protein
LALGVWVRALSHQTVNTDNANRLLAHQAKPLSKTTSIKGTNPSANKGRRKPNRNSISSTTGAHNKA